MADVATVVEVAVRAAAALYKRIKGIKVLTDDFRALGVVLLAVQELLKDVENVLDSRKHIAKPLISDLVEVLKEAGELVETASKASKVSMFFKSGDFQEQLVRVRDLLSDKLNTMLHTANLQLSANVQDEVRAVVRQIQRVQFEQSAAMVKELMGVRSQMESVSEGQGTLVSQQQQMMDMMQGMMAVIGDMTGGGKVTQQEVQAGLRELQQELGQLRERKSRNEEQFMDQITTMLRLMDVQDGAASSSASGAGPSSQPNVILEPLPCWICPISMDIMEHPVALENGTICEKHLVEKWFAAGKRTCPRTGEVLRNLYMIPLHSIRSEIQDWLAAKERLTDAHVSTEERHPPQVKKVSKVSKKAEPPTQRSGQLSKADIKTSQDPAKPQPAMADVATVVEVAIRAAAALYRRIEGIKVLKDDFRALGVVLLAVQELLKDVEEMLDSRKHIAKPLISDLIEVLKEAEELVETASKGSMVLLFFKAGEIQEQLVRVRDLLSDKLNTMLALVALGKGGCM